MDRRLLLAAVAVAVSCSALNAQAPSQLIVQSAAPAAAVPRAVAVQPAQNAAAGAAVLQTLQQMKAANEQLLSRQAATLELLDTMEKNANQMRIFSKRS